MIISFHNGLDGIIKPQDGADDVRTFSFGMEEYFSAAIVCFLNLRFNHSILMVYTDAAVAKLQACVDARPCEIIVVEAKVIGVIGFNLDSVC